MKKALSLLFMFIIFLFAGIILATIFYSFFLGVLHYVAGTNSTVFDFNTILKAFFYTLPLIIMLTPPVLCYYRVRHIGSFPQIISYIIISSLCWILFIVSLSIECVQLLIGRCFDVDDILLNLVGGMIGYFVYRFLDLITDKMSRRTISTLLMTGIIIGITMLLYMMM